MTNNQVCDILGISGCLVLFFSMGFIFFGWSSAVVTAIVGIIMGIIALLNYE